MQALLAGRALVAEDVGDGYAGRGLVLADAALARQIREQGPALVVVREPGPTLLRALRERPPALLIVTGPELPAGEVAGRVLGPAAQVAIAEGGLVVCAPEGRALGEIVAALAGRPAPVRSGSPAPFGLVPPGLRLALCPAPAWLPEWLAAPELAGCRVAGMVAAASLHAGWVAWARAAGARQVVVPLGVEAARVESPRHASLGPAAAAHALERLTGPVFPGAGVLALLVRAEMSGEAGPERQGPESMSEETLRLRAALWRQARRALPGWGAELGMEAPRPDLPPASAADAFLAQRALLRREQSLRLAQAGAAIAPPASEPAAVQRAEEVMRSAGQVLSEHESKVVLRGFGVEITRQAVASSASGAAQYAETIGFPVVLKAVSPDLRRKQELGAVILDLTNAAGVRRAYATIVANVEAHAPTAHLDGVLVAEQIPEGPEVHCGAVALVGGEVALFGRALGPAAPPEHVLCLSPVEPEEALLFAQAIVAHLPLRRKEDPDVRELARLFLRLDAMVRHFGAAGAEGRGRLELVDLSPVRLVAGVRGYVTLDARIVQRAHLEGQ